ncbi:MAG: transketolase family protein [Candidatus Nanopelagicales bacterium]
MRDAFAAALAELAAADRRIMFLTGDLGFGVFENYQRELPGQYLNVGVAEQNLIGVATGLALEGRVPFAYSIGNFPVLRCLEQIRNDAAYHDAPVKVVSIGGGFSYGPLGMSHHATEDLAIMRAIPNVSVFVPGTIGEVRPIVEAIIANPGTCYLRLDKSTGAESPSAQPFRVGDWRVMREGTDACVVASGGILGEAQAAAESLADQGISVRVVNANQLCGVEPSVILERVVTGGPVVTVEENVISGGLGGLVAETLAETGSATTLVRLGLRNQFVSHVGSQSYLRGKIGIDAQGITAAVGRIVADHTP